MIDLSSGGRLIGIAIAVHEDTGEKCVVLATEAANGAVSREEFAMPRDTFLQLWLR